MERTGVYRMMRDLRRAEDKLRGVRYNTFEIQVDIMAREAADCIEALVRENDQLRERLRTENLDYIRKMNYINLQLEQSQMEVARLRREIKHQ